MANARSNDFKTPIARLSFADSLFKARRQEGSDANSKAKFGCTLIFPKTLLKEKVIRYAGELVSLQDIVAGVIVEQWGEKGLEKAKAGLIKSPFLDGEGKEARSKKSGDLHGGMGPDVFFIRCSANEDRPPLVSRSATEVIPGTVAEVYSGCYGFAVLNAFAWTHTQNGDGVSFGISNFYKKNEGEKLGSGPADPDTWLDEKVEDAGSAPSSTRTGAGAGGLFGE